jgi:LysM repeat protein
VFAALISVASLSAAIGALSSLRPLLGVAALAVAVLILYVAMLRHARRLATEQEWASPFAADDSLEWLRPEGDAAGVWPATAETFSPAPQPALQGWAAVPFFLTCTADWLLTPVVALTRWFASARDTQRADAWAERIAAIQSSMRQRSRRALTVSVVATIGVTGLGSIMDATAARPGPANLGSSTRAAATLTSAAAPAVATSSALHYTVQPGDTLWGIAQKFGTTVDAVASANHIPDPNLIYEGETFVINGAGVHYRVRLGDTLARIAERFGTTVEALASANHIADPNLIYVGQTFLIVGGHPPAVVPKWNPLHRAVAPAAVPAWKPVPTTVHPTPVARVAQIPVRPVTPVPPTTHPVRPVARPLPTTPPVRPVLPVPTTTAVRPVTRPVAAIPPVRVAPPPVPARPVTPPPVVVSPPAGVAGYVNPFAYGSWSPARIDQGVDWIANAVSPVVAIGNGMVTYSSMHSGWPDGAFIAYRLTSGSHAGLYIYVAEHLTNLLPAGTPVRAGQVIATALPGSPFTEWGFAAPSGPVPASSYRGAVDGTATAGGRAFARFLIELGAGAPNPGPGPDRP